MSDRKEYDLFLSHASDDVEWCEMLAERLRKEGVRVWFDKWELKPGDHLLARLNDGLKSAQKMVAVWTSSYFRDDKTWTLAEVFSQQHADVLAQERPLIPLLRENTEIPPTFRNILFIDFRNDEDFDLRLRDLIHALDLPLREPAAEELEFLEHKINGDGQIGPHVKGKTFEDEIATLYRLLGFNVNRDVEVGGTLFGLSIEQKVGGLPMQAIVECVDRRVTLEDANQLLAKQNLVQRKLPIYRWLAVTSQGYALDARARLEEADISCLTYVELLHELVPLDRYAEGLISEYEQWVQEHWQSQDWFIRPYVQTDIIYETLPALERFSKWLGEPYANLLAILGDLGTGKSTLAGFLAYNLARSFRDDPLRYPAPVLIPLKEVRKEVSLEGIVISHFSKRGLPEINFPRFNHLVRTGKIILFFDAFDEMADRVRWDVTQSNFRELRRAAEQNGKVILTCRTHYFKDRNEQVKLIGEGLRLSEIETELYRELRQQSGAEVVYLQEFNDAQVQTYLQRARPQSADEDWNKIQEIYNLKELAHRPLLLDMIVKSLPRLEAGEHINAANLYKVYTELWIDREEKDKGRILDKPTKMGLMLELAWRMWHEESIAIHYNDLLPFVENIVSGKSLELGEEEPVDVASEMQAATFLRRDERGYFTFMHRSFMEYFLARKLLAYLKEGGLDGHAHNVLNTRRFNWEIIYFLTLLDNDDEIREPLQQILKKEYSPNLSENALQILYWSGRVRNRMERAIDSPEELRKVISERVPAKAQLAGANLQEITLEAADLSKADLSRADLTRAKLSHARLLQAVFREAKLTGAYLEHAAADEAVFREANLSETSFNGSSLTGSDFTGAVYQNASFIDANLMGARGLPASVKPPINGLRPVPQRGHTLRVNAVAYSQNGELIARGGEAGSVFIYRASDGQLLRTLEGHQASIRSVAFSPAEEWIASGGEDGTIRIWDVRSGLLIWVGEEHRASVMSISFSPDGEILVSGSADNTAIIWSMGSGQKGWQLKGHTDVVKAVAVSPDGELLASGSSDGSVRVWDVRSGRILRALDGHDSEVRSVAFSSDGKMLASGGGTSGQVLIWDYRTGQLLRTLSNSPTTVNSVRFSANGEFIAAGGDSGSVRIWQVKSGGLLRTLEGHKSEVNSIAFSPDGRTLLSGSRDGSLRIWEAASGQTVRLIERYQDRIRSIAMSSDGSILACGSEDGGIRLWSNQSESPVRIFEGHHGQVRALTFSPNSNVLISGGEDGLIKVWNIEAELVEKTLEGHQDRVLSLAIDPVGRVIASGSSDGTVRLWERASGELVRVLEGHQGQVRSVTLSPNGRYIASGSADGTVRVWESKSGSPIQVLEGHLHRVRSVIFSPDGKTLISGGEDMSIIIWDTLSGQLIQRLEGPRAGIRSVAISPDGKIIASGSEDMSVRIWDATNGDLLRELGGHSGWVDTVCFAPNSKYLVAAGAAGRLQFWDYVSGKPLLYRFAFGPGAWLDLLPDGHFDASPEGIRYLSYTEEGTLNSYPAEDLEKEFHDPRAVRNVLDMYVNK